MDNEAETRPVPGMAHKKKHMRVAKTDTVFQMEISECGAASLAMVMGYYGVHIPLEELRVETGVSRNGVNAKNICIAAEKYGFVARGYHRSVDRMLEMGSYPAIIHWNFCHFVVLEGYRNGKFYIDDPAQGRIRVSREEFEGSFTGVILEFLPTNAAKKRKQRRTLLDFAAARLSNEYATLRALLLLGICLILPGVLSPVFSQVFLDDILINNERSWMKWLLLFMILTCLYQAYFMFVKSRLTERFQSKMTLSSTDGMLYHLFRLPLGFYEQRFAGDLVQRVQNNIAVNTFLARDLITVSVGVLTSVIYLFIMCAYNLRLAMFGLVFSLLSLIASSLSAKVVTKYSKLYGQDYSRVVGSAYSGLAVSSSLKAAGGENEYASRVLGYRALVELSDQKLGQVQQGINVIPQTIQSINSIVILVLGSRFVLSGDLTPGMLMSFSGMLASFSAPFADILSFNRNIHQLKNDMGRVDDLMRYREDPSFHTEKIPLEGKTKLNGEVELRDISFAYGKLDHPLIRRFNMKLEAGKSVALVGASGCGKSTVAKLITSLYQPWTGEILFDGIPSDRIPKDVLSASLSIVSQNIVLFEGSIYSNITVWNDSIQQEDVIRAAKDACIHDDITKKSGSYDYILRDGGSNISGGQRQRIEIAKALATNPSILILDEATSALDTLTERKIYENIRKRGCTAIIVAQRLSSIRECDEIIVLHYGRIIERGTHEELMNLRGKYYEMVRNIDR